MLFLEFRIGKEAFLLDTSQIAEVLPLLRITPVPHAPAEIAGLFNYHGRAVPVIDLSALTLGEPARAHIGTRLILVHHGEHLLGLIAERATGVVRREASDFVDSGIMSETAPYLGPIARDGARFLQRIEVAKLLPESSSRLLFRKSKETSWSSPELQRS
jgi:chemotaxis-related protein WspB